MKRNIVIAVVTAAALVGGGTATALAVSGDDDRGASVARAEARAGDDDGRDDDRDDRDDRGEDRSDDRGDDRDERAVSGDVTAAEALAAALKHTPGTAVAAELDDGAWEVDVLGDDDGWHSVRVDPGSGKVLGASADDEDDAREVRAALKGSSVTAGEAARAAAGKGVVTSVELDDDDRGWEAETRASGGGERDWRVDLGSGKVTADRDDSDDD
ncbi:PepSY domain-containing protein [Streptomyces griseoflavus]|uniref:Asp-rich hydrophilic protein n=1 Tax=Streptomyces griseoflavus Tu4000 TaxID=467200 RepID=D9Y1A4_9ACTN|nr:PepSY domain-containing protein [Streptomyces griseoflavus]EFL39050.1 Asp-rich hydrophilic protein [Streptomyces griseoflavus Tu4000]